MGALLALTSQNDQAWRRRTRDGEGRRLVRVRRTWRSHGDHTSEQLTECARVFVADSTDAVQRVRSGVRLDGGYALARAISSAGERSPHTREVTGSIPVSPTHKSADQARFAGPFEFHDGSVTAAPGQ